MDLDEVMGTAWTILVVEMESIEVEEGDGWIVGEYTLVVLDTIKGWADSGATVECFYRLNLPRTFESAGGQVTWVSPLESGSGLELITSPGDTMIALFGSSRATGRGTQVLERLEPLEMRDSIEALLELEEAVATPETMEDLEEIEVGQAYAQRFRWIAGQWRPAERVSSSLGIRVSWQWENEGDWEWFLSDTSGTVLIAYRVLELRWIGCGGWFEDMPGSFVPRIVCRILDAFRWEIPPGLTR